MIKKQYNWPKKWLIIALIIISLSLLAKPLSNSYASSELLIQCQNQSFDPAPGSPLTVDTPFSGVSGDFNKDGKPDLATTISNEQKVAIFLGNGDGSFAEPIYKGVFLTPNSIKTADFNGDGNLDLVTVNQDSDDISILLGDGTGHFSDPTNFFLGENKTPLSVIVTDFNKDGKLDLAVADFITGDISILLGDGTGNFNLVNSVLTGDIEPIRLVSGDFNKDGRLDLAVLNIFSSTSDDLNGTLTIMFGDGEGNFRVFNTITVGERPTSLITADLNSDGKLDIVVTNADSDDVSILLGDDTGNFTLETSLTPGSHPTFVIDTDLNGDNKVDLAIISLYSGTVSVYFGNGTTSFPQQPLTFAAGSFPQFISINDFNQDGRLDLSVGSVESLSTFLGSCNDGPDQIITQSGSNQTTNINTNFALPFEVIVKDNAGNPLPNVQVTFDAATSGVGGTFSGQAQATVTTDNNGSAISPIFTANSIAGSYQVTASVQRSNGSVISTAFLLTNINPCAGSNLVLSPNSLPGGTVGISYNQTISVNGGAPPYTFIVNSGSIPTGLVLASDGKLSGTPTTSGNFTFSISAIDIQGCSAAKQYSFVIGCPTITLSPSTLPNGQKGVAYNQTIVVSGGNSPYHFVSTGVIPPGLALNSSTGLLAGTPTTSGTFNFTVVASDSTGCASGQISYTLTIQPGSPAIVNFTPTSGPAGVSVTITGTNFSGATSVRFNNVAATFTVDSDSQLSTTVPATASTGPISVITPIGTATSSTSFTVTHIPTITSFTPLSGKAGTTVTITGTDFTGITAVKFNTSAATFNVVSSTSITATVPLGATTGKISATNSAGTASSTNNFTVLPQITSFSPTGGAAGSTVTITGSGFTGAIAVKFGTLVAQFAVNSDTQITATVPATAVTGTISVTTPAGTAVSATAFSIVKPPTITSFTPASGAVGTIVTVSGSNFVGVTDVKFNGQSAVFTISTTTSLKATVPVGATTGKISVTNSVGTASSANNFNVAPKINSFSPAVGIAGTTVLITGTNFTGVTAVKFGTTIAQFTFNSDSQITTTVPATALTGSISVTTPAGTSTSATTFTVVKPPTVTSFTPASAAVGASITISGSNFSDLTSVKFNSIDATFTVSTSTSLKATVPVGATTGKITVTNPAGTGSSVAIFKVLPKISDFSPKLGVVGTSVVITGANFTGATLVKFGAVTAQFTVDSDTQITTAVPAGAVTGAISVTTTAGAITSTALFTVIKPPTITSFTPASGKVGTIVTINGTNLVGVSDVKFNGASAVTITPVTANQIKVTVPTDATTGKITVVNPAGSVTSIGSFTVLP